MERYPVRLTVPSVRLAGWHASTSPKLDLQSATGVAAAGCGGAGVIRSSPDAGSAQGALASRADARGSLRAEGLMIPHNWTRVFERDLR